MAWSYLKKTDLYAWMDVLFFFMPWFFFKSGQFHRDGHYLRQLLSSARRLLIPCVVFSLAGYAVKCYTLSLHNDFSVHLTRVWTKFSHEGVLPGNGPLWFLLVLSGEAKSFMAYCGISGGSVNPAKGLATERRRAFPPPFRYIR